MKARIVRRFVSDPAAIDMPPPHVVRAVERAKAKVARQAAIGTAWDLLNAVTQGNGKLRFAFCGSIRRERPTVGDIDILILPPSEDAGRRMLDTAERVADTLEWRGAVKIHLTFGGLPCDILLTTHESWGSALQYLTGSRWHNIGLRRDAQERGLKLNEYGVWAGGVRIAGRTEPSVYEAVGRRWIHPRFRQSPLDSKSSGPRAAGEQGEGAA